MDGMGNDLFHCDQSYLGESGFLGLGTLLPQESLLKGPNNIHLPEEQTKTHFAEDVLNET